MYYQKDSVSQPQGLASMYKGQGPGTEHPNAGHGRLVLRGGHVVDPKNGVDRIADVTLCGQNVEGVSDGAQAMPGDAVVDCRGLLVLPGLIDMHVHLGDLFEITTDPIFCAAQDGVTVGLSPGAGNTLMAPSLLGAEVDRGVPINLGVYLGAAAVLATCMDADELVQMFSGQADPELLARKMTRNGITNATAPFVVGIKDHMGHFIMSDQDIDRVYDITSRAGLVYMSHTQDPAHAERMVALSKGRPIHLAHATAAGCGTHAIPEEGFRRVLDLIDDKQVTGEFVTTMLRPGGGCREGLKLPERCQEMAFQALADGKVKILVSDGQNQATMKGFGDTRDDIPAILELSERGVLSLSDSVACMTCNPAKLIATRTGNPWWAERMGNLSAGALANVTVVNPATKRATYTIVNGQIVSFESRVVRRGMGAGGWVSRFGMARRTSVGDLAMFSRA